MEQLLQNQLIGFRETEYIRKEALADMVIL